MVAKGEGTNSKGTSTRYSDMNQISRSWVVIVVVGGVRKRWGAPTPWGYNAES